MYERIDGKYYISIKNLIILLDANITLINKEIVKNKIESIRIGRSRYITRKDSNIVKKNLSRDKKCNMCGKEFVAKTRNEKYCSKHCRDKNNQLNFKKGATNKSIGTVLMEGRNTRSKIMTCSIDCMLKELGDIE